MAILARKRGSLFRGFFMAAKKKLDFHTKTTIGADITYDQRKEKCASIIANVRAMDFSKSRKLRELMR